MASNIKKISEQLLTRIEVANRLAVSPQTVWRLTAAGELPAVKIGRSTRYRESTLDELIAAREQN